MRTGDYLELWVQTYCVPFRAANTVACYRRAIRSLPSAVVDCSLEQLHPLAIQCAINTQAIEHPRAAQLTYTTLHAALGRAAKLGLVAANPVAACDKPIHTARRAQVLDVPQLRRYIDGARDSECWPLLLLMATCGLRRSEALGLMRSDIDGNVLHIQRQRIRSGGVYAAAPLKSRSSMRDIPLPDAVVNELAHWPVYSVDGWIYDTTPERMRLAHMQVIEAAGLPPVTLHGLRHSCATAIAEQGTPIKLLQALLGHAHYQLTADLYTAHVHAPAYAPDVARYCALVM